jgi:two-component system, cell cycle response regulator DivK
MLPTSPFGPSWQRIKVQTINRNESALEAISGKGHSASSVFSNSIYSLKVVIGGSVMLSHLNKAKAPGYEFGPGTLRTTQSDIPVVLMVEDQEEARAEMKQVLELNGYRVIDTDNGQDAVKRARVTSPDLVLVDLNVPLLYELVAARQIIKSAQLGILPVVIVTREDTVDPAAMMEVGVRRNEYVTRLSDYQQLEHLLDYLLPTGPRVA